MKNIYTFLFFFLISFANAQTADLIPFKKGDKYGYCDRNKKIIIPIQYKNAFPFGYETDHSFYQDYASVENENGAFIINKKGEIIDNLKNFKKKSQEEYDRSEEPPRIEDLKTVKYNKFTENDKDGVKDENGQVILKPIYDNLYIFSFSNHYWDKKNKKYYNPTYASVEKDKNSYLIRIDQIKHYDDYTLTKFDGDEFFIVKTYKNGDTQYGIFTEENIKLYDPKFIKIMKYYDKLQLLFVTKIVNNYPYDFYIDVNGTEFYE